ncbi:hypothetical protein LTR70_009430, partial [Exophiala xenobiotica]
QDEDRMATTNGKLQHLLLHAHDTGPNPIKIAIALELLQVPYDIKLWEFGDDPMKGVKGKAFLAINENGRLPALEDPNTGIVAWESGAVMNYILRRYDQDNQLGPRGSSEQDLIDYDKWTLFLLTTLGPMTGQTNWFRHYNEVKNEDALQRYITQTYRTYDVLEAQLEKSNGMSVLPGGISAVDFHFYPWVDEYKYAQLSLDPYPNIRHWLSSMGERPDVKDVYAKLAACASA